MTATSPDGHPPQIRTPLRSLARHWRLAAALGAGMAVIGAVIFYFLPITYVAESRIAVGSSDLDIQTIPGYSLGTQQLASSFSRYVNNTDAADGYTRESGASLNASPIPESNIIRIESSASSKEAAVKTAQSAADGLVKQIESIRNGINADQSLAVVQATSTEKARAQQTVTDREGAYNKAPSPEAAKALEDARVAFDIATVKNQAANAKYQESVSAQRSTAVLTLVRKAAIVMNSRSTNLQRGILLGAAIGLAVALFLAMRTDERDERIRYVSHMAQLRGEMYNVQQ